MTRPFAPALPAAAIRAVLMAVSVLGLVPPLTAADDPALARRLQRFDAYMEKIVKDWNVPGIGVGIVVKDRLVLAKGYGYRDYGRKPGELFNPWALVRDSQGRIHVLDSNNHRVQRFVL